MCEDKKGSEYTKADVIERISCSGMPDWLLEVQPFIRAMKAKAFVIVEEDRLQATCS